MSTDEKLYCARCQRELKGARYTLDNPDGEWVQIFWADLYTMKATKVENVCVPCSRDGGSRLNYGDSSM